ncbi:MAG: AAA family ATPase, partial [Ilumatobacteraceae bacterium]
ELSFVAKLPNDLDDEDAHAVLAVVLDDARLFFKRLSVGAEPERSPASTMTESAPTVDSILAEFDSLVGTDEVERQVQDLVTGLKVHQARLAAGLRSQAFAPHLVLTGNPGTGKTTVARLIAQLYRALGLLPSGQVIEVSRADLVGQYVGETEVKTLACVERALGGVLFIDEAYALTGKGSKDFGTDAIDVLLVEMENRRGQFAIIAAGYQREMATFLDSNPGLQSRFDHAIQFRDFTTDELIEIFERRASSEDYVLVAGVQEALRVVLEQTPRGENFSNGRLVRRLFDRTRINQQRRLHSEGLFDVDSLRLIVRSDVDFAGDFHPPTRRPIGFQRW